jgi:hypothetical protein
VRHGRVARRVDGAEEEERSRLDEGGGLVVEVGLHGHRFEHVRERAAVEAILERAVVVVEQSGHGDPPPAPGSGSGVGPDARRIRGFAGSSVRLVSEWVRWGR